MSVRSENTPKFRLKAPMGGIPGDGQPEGDSQQAWISSGQVSPTRRSTAERDTDASRVNSNQTASSSGKGSTSGSSFLDLQSAVASEVVYCLVSAGTILFNKHALSSFDFPAPNTLLLFQFVLAVALLKFLDILGFLNLQPMRLDIVKLWLPCNLIFVLMNVSGFYALRDIGAGMFTVLKNLSNLLTIVGDYVIYGNTYSWQVWLCLGLMVISAMLGGWTDLTFSVSGYAWQLVNCCFTAAYSLYLSGVIKKLSKDHYNKAQLNEMSMVYYNNVLSVPPLLLLSLSFGEPWHLGDYHHLLSFEFQMVAVVGGLLGFGVSFASIWCMSRTSPTIYSLTGSLNKVIVVLVGMWYFKEKATFLNMCSITAGLAAGFLFVFAKQSTTQAQSKSETDPKGYRADAETGEAGPWPGDAPKQIGTHPGHPLMPVAGSQAYLLNGTMHKSS